MSLNPAEKETRKVLRQHCEEAANGELTTGEVVALVREAVPGARSATIHRYIESYGPIGENDLLWLTRARKGELRSWFFSPYTGEEVS